MGPTMDNDDDKLNGSCDGLQTCEEDELPQMDTIIWLDKQSAMLVDGNENSGVVEEAATSAQPMIARLRRLSAVE